MRVIFGVVGGVEVKSCGSSGAEGLCSAVHDSCLQELNHLTFAFICMLSYSDLLN